jgi:hypothetical protein
MAMTSKDKHAKYYKHEREHDWQKQGIVNATYALYQHLLEVQHYTCAMPACNNVVNETSPLDHNHKTGLVRGVLCQDCNKRLGFIENIKRVNGSNFLSSALQYLQQY